MNTAKWVKSMLTKGHKDYEEEVRTRDESPCPVCGAMRTMEGFKYVCHVCDYTYDEPAIVFEREIVTADDLLETARSLINQRGKERDKASGERSMRGAVLAFNALFGASLTETQGWTFMLLLKLSRSAGGAYKQDDYLDAIAYAALAAECADRELSK
jgi:hypothetical protein